MRYSTARCGLLKLARMALWTCSRGNPMLTISLTLVSSADPLMNDVDESPGCCGFSFAGAGVSGSVAAGAAAAGAGAGAFGTAGVVAG